MPKLNLSELANRLENMRCNEHNKSPEITFGEFAIYYSNICCDKFGEELDLEYEKLVNEYVENKFKKFL